MECVVCTCEYDRLVHEPRNLPCGHTFCGLCIKVVDECPECRGRLEWLDQEAKAPVNHTILKAIETLRTPKETAQDEGSPPPAFLKSSKLLEGIEEERLLDAVQELFLDVDHVVRSGEGGGGVGGVGGTDLGPEDLLALLNEMALTAKHHIDTLEDMATIEARVVAQVEASNPFQPHRKYMEELQRCRVQVEAAQCTEDLTKLVVPPDLAPFTPLQPSLNATLAAYLDVCKADVEEMRKYSTEVKKPLKDLSMLLRRPMKPSVPAPAMDAVEEGLLDDLFQ